MGIQLVVGTLIVLLSVVFHIVCLIGAFAMLQFIELRTEQWWEYWRAILLLGFAVLMVIAVHTAEVWGWAVVYCLVGEFSVFENALYFSAVTSTTLGFGDIVLSEKWRLMSSFEGMGGLILFGVSTAFLFALTRRLFDMHYVKGRQDHAK